MRFHIVFSMLILTALTGHAQATPEQKARLMWERIVGSYGEADDASLAQMANLIRQGQPRQAAAVATANKRFVDYTVGKLVSPWSNREKNPNVTYNSVMALAQGLVRDNRDFRQFLTGNILYATKANVISGRTTPGASRTSEANWLFIQENGLSPTDALEAAPRSPQWSDVTNFSDFAGVYTLGTSKHLYTAGTNRRPVEWTFQTFMCKKDLSEVADITRGDAWVGRDVDRADRDKFRGTCVGCHGAILDPLRGAFAFLDNDANGNIAFLSSVAPKYANNNTMYSLGYVTTDNRWENNILTGRNQDLGWRGMSAGNGVNALATMVANSQEFSRCMVTHVFRQVCLREPTRTESDRYVRSIAGEFEENSAYNLRRVYEAVASLEECSGN